MSQVAKNVSIKRVSQRAVIGVGKSYRSPRPPNPVCGSPATGSPVSCIPIGIGAPLDGPRAS